jgi:hypothetical protein
MVVGGCDSCGLILGLEGFPLERRGIVSERQEDRGSLCPRGLGSLCFDGLPGGMRSASAWLG